MEVQSHGLIFEDMMVKSLTGFSKTEYQRLLPGSYRSSMDILKEIHSSKNVSIKCSKYGENIDCADVANFYHHTTTNDFTLLVGCWDQVSSNQKLFYEILEIYITPSLTSTLWGRSTIAGINQFVDYIKSIPPGATAQLEHKNKWKEYRSKLFDGSGLMQINAKIDSKTQRRVQCSIKIKELIKSGITYETFKNDYHGIKLPFTIESKPRYFSKS